MRSILTLLLFMVLSVSGLDGLKAQCVFTPTITPNNLILCPNEQDTLWTQSFDGYQWYKDGQAVPGATQQYYVVDAFNDAGYFFKVEATQGSCTEMSDSVLVDGWAFLPPFVISDGNFTLCPGIDSVIFTLGQPYTENIQWFDAGVPIGGANDDTLIVYAPGSFTVEGAPPQCPAFIQTLGVSLDVSFYEAPVVTPGELMLCSGGQDSLIVAGAAPGVQWYWDGVPVPGANQGYFITDTSGAFYVTTTQNGCTLSSNSVTVTEYTPIVPVISQSGNHLIVSPGAPTLTNFQWLLNGVPLAGATDTIYTPAVSGAYTVSAEDSSCVTTSEPFSFVSTGVPGMGRELQLTVYPNPFTSVVHIKSSEPVSVAVFSLDGKMVMDAGKTDKLDLGFLAPGVYVARVTDVNGVVVKNIKLTKQE
jgi:hypothetical protein